MDPGYTSHTHTHTQRMRIIYACNVCATLLKDFLFAWRSVKIVWIMNLVGERERRRKRERERFGTAKFITLKPYIIVPIHSSTDRRCGFQFPSNQLQTLFCSFNFVDLQMTCRHLCVIRALACVFKRVIFVVVVIFFLSLMFWFRHIFYRLLFSQPVLSSNVHECALMFMCKLPNVEWDCMNCY